jgi:hypothetical protein
MGIDAQQGTDKEMGRMSLAQGVLEVILGYCLILTNYL